MPVSLNKIRKLQDIAKQVTPDETSGYRRHNKNSPAYWQVTIHGKKWGIPFDSRERALKYIEEVNIKHMLPSIDRVSKDEFNRKSDSTTTKTS